MTEPSPHDRVKSALDEANFTYDVVRTTPARSAEESAQLQAIELSQLLKTIVVRKGEGDHVFFLVPANRSIDWKKLRRVLGVGRASLPDRDEAEAVTGFRIGTITPFGSSAKLEIILDSAALAHPEVALGAGEPGVNVHVLSSELQGHPRVIVADVTGEASDGRTVRA